MHEQKGEPVQNLKADLKHIMIDFKQMSQFMKDPLIMVEADGVRYKDINGKSYLDGISGIFVVTIGHNNPRAKKAILDQLEKIAFAPPLHATNPAAIKLAKLVSEVTPGDLNTVKLVSGGSEAIEAAMKLTRQYHRQSGNPNKYKFVARYQGYHGATMGALSATGVARRKAMFEPTLQGYMHVMPPTCYRCPYEKVYPECGAFCAKIVGDVIRSEGPETVAGVILEPIGNTGGIITPPDQYFSVLRDICDQHQVLLIFDEIITGFARTGNMFASQTFGVTPDIICMGKSMSSGYAPLGAIACTDKIAEAFWGETGLEFSHGHTFGGNPIASAVGIASIEEIQEKNLCSRAQELGKYLRDKLENMDDKGVIGDIRGKGLLIGVEFVMDKETKEPFPDELKFGVKVGEKAMEKGLILRFDPHWIAFAPPLVITEEEIDEMINIFQESVQEVVKEVKRKRQSN